MVSSISPTPRKRALVDGKKWTNQSYVTIWMFVYFSKHGQIYVCNNLEGFACRPIYFRKQSFNKRKFPALEWEMQNHLANVNFPGYWVWSHNDHCDDAKAGCFDDDDHIFRYRRWQWSWPWRLPHVPNIFALRHVLTDASSSRPHVLPLTSQWALLFLGLKMVMVIIMMGTD